MGDIPHPRYVRHERDGRLSFSKKLYQGIGEIPDTVENWVFNTVTLSYYNRRLEGAGAKRNRRPGARAIRRQ